MIDEIVRIFFSKFFWKFFAAVLLAIIGFMVGNPLVAHIVWMIAACFFTSAFFDFLETF